MGYCSIGQTGFFTLTLIAMKNNGHHVIKIATFYLIAYALSHFAMFTLLILYNNKAIDTMKHYKGLAKKNMP
jgi:NADH:ubiquinone oxidoreductase subunit 2 (subunit N)